MNANPRRLCSRGGSELHATLKNVKRVAEFVQGHSGPVLSGVDFVQPP